MGPACTTHPQAGQKRNADWECEFRGWPLGRVVGQGPSQLTPCLHVC